MPSKGSAGVWRDRGDLRVQWWRWRWHGAWARMLVRWLLAGLAVWPAVGAPAEALRTDALPGGPLGQHTQLLTEPAGGPSLSWREALQRLARGDFQPATQRVLSHGLGAAPVWVHLPLHNPGTLPQAHRLLAGTSWLDQLDVLLLQDGRPLQQWQAGDERGNAGVLVPVQGLAFDLLLPPGRSTLLLRLQSHDPSVLPLELLPADAVLPRERAVMLAQGLLAGFLLALVTSYALLYGVLRERSHLNYALYVACFLVLNATHTGFGQAWVWPASPGIGRYVILVTMVAFCCMGLVFTRHLLGLARTAPRVDRLLRCAVVGAPVALLAGIAADSQLLALRVAFGFTTVFSVGMVLVGVLAVHQRNPAGRSFLAAVLFSTAGALTTTAAVLGWLPFNTFTYHAVALGVVMEATIWALMLGVRLRQQQRDSLQARDMARRDPLTGLNNRRGFIQQAQARWQQAAEQPGQRLSVVMLDLDHFKQVNDHHGHAAGDAALEAVAALLSSSCRMGDVLARWGGEEFMLLLPDTGLAHAHALAERMRQRLETLTVMAGPVPLRLTASFGVAECEPGMPLEALLRTVDEQLYAAKQAGRNQVVPGSARRVPATAAS